MARGSFKPKCSFLVDRRPQVRVRVKNEVIQNLLRGKFADLSARWTQKFLNLIPLRYEGDLSVAQNSCGFSLRQLARANGIVMPTAISNKGKAAFIQHMLKEQPAVTIYPEHFYY